MPRTSDVLSSSDFRTDGFAPHGDFRVRFDDGLLLWENRGPFNLEAMQRFGMLRREAYKRWQLDKRWCGSVVHWLGSALMSPDAFAAYQTGFDRFMSQHHTQVAVAWVVQPGVEGIDFMLGRFERLFAEHGLPLQVFAATAPAQVWVRGQLALPRAAVPVTAD